MGYNLQLTDTATGKSIHDSRVFRNTALYQRTNNEILLESKLTVNGIK